jgi:hypothetical protein
VALTTKVLEVRDRNTFVAMLATKLDTSLPPVDWYLRRCGYPLGCSMILLTRLDGGGCVAHNDPYGWGDRTFHIAHRFIEQHWHELNDGSVVDVEFILKETKIKKESERFDAGIYGTAADRGAAAKPRRSKRVRTTP